MNNFKTEKAGVLLALKKYLEEKNKRGGQYDIDKWLYEFENVLDGLSTGYITKKIMKTIESDNIVTKRYFISQLNMIEKSLIKASDNLDKERYGRASMGISFCLDFIDKLKTVNNYPIDKL